MTTSFEFDPLQSTAALARMQRAPDGLVALSGADWSQAAMGALVQAEFLAADAGLVPWFTLPTGERGVLTVGAAREKINDAPEDIRTLYLATHGLVRSTHASAQPWNGEAPSIGDELGAVPIVIIVGVIAIAAIVATAWYATRSSTIEVEGRNVRATAVVAEASALAREQLARTGKIDPGVWEVFRSIADSESGHSWIPWAVGGVVLGGVGGALAWRHWRARGRNEVRR